MARIIKKMFNFLRGCHSSREDNTCVDEIKALDEKLDKLSEDMTRLANVVSNITERIGANQDALSKLIDAEQQIRKAIEETTIDENNNRKE